MSRGRFLKVRVSDAELDDIRARAFGAEMTISDFLRHRVMNFRVRQTNAEKARVRQLACIGSNVNQLARWANTHKAAGPALEVVLWLNRLTREVADIAHDEGDDGGKAHAD